MATLLDLLRADGGHSSYNPLYTSYLYNQESYAASWITSELVNEVNQFIDSLQGYEELDNANNGYHHTRDIYRARASKLGKQARTLSGTNNVYTKVGKTAFIHIDGFMQELNQQTAWKDYYNGSRSDRSITENYSGSVGSMYYCGLQVEQDPSVENVVIDLSANGGGSTDEMLYLLSILTGENTLYTYSYTNKNIATTTYEIDRNLDRAFDEDDKAFNPFKNKNVVVLTSQNGFSCGGISPVYLHESGLFTIGDNPGGGSCAIYLGTDAYGVSQVTSCPTQIVTKNGVSIDVTRNTTCDYKIDILESGNILDFSLFFDVDNINSIIENNVKA